MVRIKPSSPKKQEQNDNLLDDPDSNEAAHNPVIDQTNPVVLTATTSPTRSGTILMRYTGTGSLGRS